MRKDDAMRAALTRNYRRPYWCASLKTRVQTLDILLQSCMTPSFMSSSQRPRSRFRSSACCYRLDKSKLRWLRISICEIGATTQADRAMSSAMWFIAIAAAYSHVRVVPKATWAGAASLRMRAPPRGVFDRAESATSARQA